jgi:catechol 2,3-dioxygenase-like lactoylglutathione lyase family enzyme
MRSRSTCRHTGEIRMNHIVGFDHVQVAMPRGMEDAARSFYGSLLGLVEIPKPATTASRGGLWFECGSLQLHLGVEDPFTPARKAHPALRVRSYEVLLARLTAAGCKVVRDTALPGVSRAFIEDPFGNRIELVNVEAGEHAAGANDAAHQGDRSRV